MRKAAGFTLIELMVTTGLLGILAMAVLGAFRTQKLFYNSNERVVETQEDARLVLDLLAFDTRMAGFMIPPVVAVSSADGGANAPDRLCVSDSGYFDLPDTTTPLTSINGLVDRFHAANSRQVTVVTANTVTVQSLDIDGNSDGQIGENHFGNPGDGIIVSDGARTFCGAISNVNTATRQITVAPGHAPMPAFANPNALRAIPAILYEVIATAGVNGPGSALNRNGLLLSPNIEDLQVEYWADLSVPPDGDVTDLNESQIQDLNNPLVAMDTSRIRRVRISVVSRGSRADVGSTLRFGGGQRPAVANRVAGAADNFVRRIFTTTVMPRNIMTTP